MLIDANVIGSHTIYKIKVDDNNELKIKALIAPHGNEDDLKEVLNKDCVMCPPAGLRVLESIAALMGWNIYKACVTSAFLQAVEAARDIYVKPRQESKMRTTHLWLLLTAAYGLVNSNVKWQYQSDYVIPSIGLAQSKHRPQLFYNKRKVN